MNRRQVAELAFLVALGVAAVVVVIVIGGGKW